MDNVVFRRATKADAQQVADVYLASRNAFLPYAPIAHSNEAVRQWVADNLMLSGNVSVAVVDGDKTVGMMVLSHKDGIGWIDHLYLLCDAVGQGLGSEFVERAKAELGSPIRLYTFQQNDGACRFYERHGFLAIEYGDGSGNEEGCPDVLYEWAEN